MSKLILNLIYYLLILISELFVLVAIRIFSGNLRQNILFGSLYDQTRYENVVRACGLEDDIMQFPNGDKTIVGERGVSLSGGQVCIIKN